MSETAVFSNRSASRSYDAGTALHSDESTTSLSQTSTSSASARLSQFGSPRQRQNAGRSEMSSGRTTDAGCSAASPRSRNSITSDSTSRPPGNSKSRIVASASTPLLPAGQRHEDDRARRVALGQAREDALGSLDPARRRPDDVRHGARPQLGHGVGLLEAALARQLPLDLRDDAHQCLRHDRPSRWSSSSARAGPQLPAG